MTRVGPPQRLCSRSEARSEFYPIPTGNISRAAVQQSDRISRVLSSGALYSFLILCCEGLVETLAENQSN